MRRLAGVDVDQLEEQLRQALRDGADGEVLFDPGTRSAYSTDASNYRQLPLGVVVPRSPDAAAAAVAVCGRLGAPIVSRGGGTSLAGQCTNTAVVLDWSVHCDAVESLDVENRRCVVQPGVVLDVLNGRLAEHGLRYGPEPSTHPNCTLGGMIGNNSCGATAQAYGKVVDNLRRMEVVTARGDRFWVGPTDDPTLPELSCDAVLAEGGPRADLYRAMRDLADRYGDLVRERYPRIPRRVSGYNLDSLLPENGFHVAKALVGSESTCVTVLRAELELVPLPKAHTLVVLGYPDVATSADAVPSILPHRPAKLEGVDERLIDLERTKGLHAEHLNDLPDGGAWLFVSFDADDRESADAAARRMLDDLRDAGHEPSSTFIDDEAKEQALWAVREAGLGATARPGGVSPATAPDTWPGWEDAAVSPDVLGAYLRDYHDLLERFGYHDVSVYGHFGQGCVHCRIPFDLVTHDGVETFRAFLDAAAHLVVRYGGSLSGEHGDGQGRGALLEIMYGRELVQAMREFRAIWDPDGLMNPGKIVDPNSPIEDLRLGTGWSPTDPTDTFFRYPEDDGRFERAVMRCVGVGKCHSPQTSGRVMCPSYRATHEERHSTRGRSRLLFEMLDGHDDGLLHDGWRSTEVLDALDLCLACKGCRSDCPMHVDMATYKAEFLAHHWQGRVRPRTHYAMGWLPVWARFAALAPGLVNAVGRTPATARLLKAAGGIAQERAVPEFAPMRFTTWFRRREARGDLPRGDGRHGEVLLWPDTFSNHFHPQVAIAAVRVLEDAGLRVRIPDGELCCGLTWISTGQLGAARKILRRTAQALAPAVTEGLPVVGLEPSCTAVFRADAHDLLPGDRDVQRLTAATRTLAEVLLERNPDWSPLPDRRADASPRAEALVQVHCHQHAVLGQGPDVELLGRAGLDAQVLDSGCCGLAGDFGFTDGHYDVSMACAEEALLPALRAAAPGTAVVADGFSCRTQIGQSDVGRGSQHLAQVLAAALDARSPDVAARDTTDHHTEHGTTDLHATSTRR